MENILKIREINERIDQLMLNLANFNDLKDEILALIKVRDYYKSRRK